MGPPTTFSCSCVTKKAVISITNNNPTTVCDNARSAALASCICHPSSRFLNFAQIPCFTRIAQHPHGCGGGNDIGSLQLPSQTQSRHEIRGPWSVSHGQR